MTIGLSPDPHTIAEAFVQTTNGNHTLYVQEWGAADGVPILFLHGGPGAGCNDGHKALFDPDRHRVVFVDQRGSGRSSPHGAIEGNTTQNLVDDLEVVRSHLSIASWHVTGGSWGSMLALCYALAHPAPLRSLVLRAIFLGTRQEIDWVEKGGYRQFFPDEWDRIYGDGRGSDASISIDEYARLGAVLGSLSGGEPGTSLSDTEVRAARIERHYNDNGFFVEDAYVLRHAEQIGAPTSIVHGRFDMLTPPVTAYALYRRLPTATLHMTVAGHSGADHENLAVTRALLATLT